MEELTNQNCTALVQCILGGIALKTCNHGFSKMEQAVKLYGCCILYKLHNTGDIIAAPLASRLHQCPIQGAASYI